MVGELLGKEAEYIADCIADRLVQRGEAEGLRQAVEAVCLLLNIQLTAEREAFLLGLNASDLNEFRAILLEKREWPGAVKRTENLIVK